MHSYIQTDLYKNLIQLFNCICYCFVTFTFFRTKNDIKFVCKIKIRTLSNKHRTQFLKVIFIIEIILTHQDICQCILHVNQFVHMLQLMTYFFEASKRLLNLMVAIFVSQVVNHGFLLQKCSIKSYYIHRIRSNITYLKNQ